MQVKAGGESMGEDAADESDQRVEQISASGGRSYWKTTHPMTIHGDSFRIEASHDLVSLGNMRVFEGRGDEIRRCEFVAGPE